MVYESKNSSSVAINKFKIRKLIDTNFTFMKMMNLKIM